MSENDERSVEELAQERYEDVKNGRAKRLADQFRVLESNKLVSFQKVGMGILCLDVGYGPELMAFEQMFPNVKLTASELILSETDFGEDEKDTYSGLILDWDVLKIVAQKTQAEVYDLSAIDAIKQMKSEGKGVGLITSVYTLPERTEVENLEKMLNAAKDVLVEGGYFLIASDGPEGENLRKLSQQKVDGYELKWFPASTYKVNAIGDDILIARRVNTQGVAIT